MTIVIGADHRGYHLKESLKNWLVSQGHTVDDKGAPVFEKEDDYTSYASPVSEVISQSQDKPEEVLGILICGSGVGMAIAANKFPGVRCGQALVPEQVLAAKKDDDINILSLAADYVSEREAEGLVDTFLTTPFSGQERHLRRLDKISSFEKHA